MGSSASAAPAAAPGGELRLPACGLRFSPRQLRALNSHVDALWEEDQTRRMSARLESEVEALVQRLVDGAGRRDARFRCDHLLALHRGKKMRSRSLEYLVPLDALPELGGGGEGALEAGAGGAGRVRLAGGAAERWADLLSPAGYLCRDKLIEKWVELIAQSAGARGGGGSRVLSARARARARPRAYCYLERASPAPGAGARRLAVVQGAAWVMVRVGAGEGEAKLALAARVRGCRAADAARAPLAHPLALLHYTTLQEGYYAVAAPADAPGERGSAWQLWNPALEAALDAHCCDLSTVGKISGALNALIDNMREGEYQGSLRAVSRHAAQGALRRRLQRCAGAARCLAPHAARHLLLVLDELAAQCAAGGAGAARRGARAADWAPDAACLRRCLQRLHRVAGLAGEDIPPTPAETLEVALFRRWESINREAKASAGGTYSRRQLRYLWKLCSELLKCKNLVIYDSHSAFRANLIQMTSPNNESIEELIHIIAIMLDQARDLYMNNCAGAARGPEVDRELAAYRSKKWSKLKDYYDASSACLIDAVRRDPALARADLADRLAGMKLVLQWLHKGAKDDKKYLGPVLKPYLDELFMSSLENSWFLEDLEGRSTREEEGLKEYCSGVHEGLVEPCMGLLDAAKSYSWAKAMVDFVDRFKHVEFRLVFPAEDGARVAVPARLPSRRAHAAARTRTLSRRDKDEAKLRLARRAVLAAFSAPPDRLKANGLLRRDDESEEVLASVQTGSYWRSSTKPDLIPTAPAPGPGAAPETGAAPEPGAARARRRPRHSRPATACGFPEISITTDSRSMRRKYHTLKSLVYREPAPAPGRALSAGGSRRERAPSRPSLLETLDFINSVRDALCVEESGASDLEESAWSLEEEWLVGLAAPLNVVAQQGGAGAPHLAGGNLVAALLDRGNFTVLQELCALLGPASEGALYALHRLARAARSRSSERLASAWKLPEADGAPAPVQRYRSRPPEAASGDEAPPPPPPPPRTSSMERHISPRYEDYLPPSRYEPPSPRVPHPPYTGVINPLYDIKMPRDKFSVKRSKSLGRSCSTRSSGLDMSRYTLTLGARAGRRTNDVVTAITHTSGETGLDTKNNFFQKSAADVVGDSYRLSRVTID